MNSLSKKNNEVKNLSDLVSKFFDSISKKFFPSHLIDSAVVYLNNNSSLAAKDHIIFTGMKSKLGIENDFYSPPYSEKKYTEGLANVISNLHEHLGMERPKLEDIINKLEKAIPKEVDSLIGGGRGKNS